METLTPLLLTLDAMKKIPLELLKEISGMVLDKPVMRAVLGQDIKTLASIYYFQPQRILDEEIKIMFTALKYSRSSDHGDLLLRWFDNKHILKTD